MNSVYLGCNQLFADDAGQSAPDEVVGKTDYDFVFSKEEAECYRTDDHEVMTSGISKLNYEEPQTNSDGKVTWLNTSKLLLRNDRGEAYGVLGTYEDITDRKEVEEQLRQSQKMDAIGQLAGGIAHDFNNMLGGILGAAELLGQRLEKQPDMQAFTTMIIDTAERAGGLTEKLLAFSRQQPRLVQPMNMHKVVDDSVVLLRNTVDRRIDVVVELEAPDDLVMGDVSQLHSVILNLGINAAQAMPEGGRFSIASSLIDLDTSDCEMSTFELRPGPYIQLEMRDTGMGVAPEHLSHIFEPFFTTKEQGKGTGLGLASVFGTVQHHGGAITVSSVENEGTCFRLLLPLLDEQVPVEKKGGQPLLRGTGHILVVDDEEVVRTTAEILLTELGYTVEVAINGQEGLDCYAAAAEPFDLVILDMMMPEMNGRDCFKRMREMDPAAKVMLSSGFSREEDLEQMEGLVGYIHKPYRLQSLSTAVHQALGTV